VHGLSTLDRAQLNEDMTRDPYVVLLLDAHDQLVLLCKQLEEESGNRMKSRVRKDG